MYKNCGQGLYKRNLTLCGQSFLKLGWIYVKIFQIRLRKVKCAQLEFDSPSLLQKQSFLRLLVYSKEFILKNPF